MGATEVDLVGLVLVNRDFGYCKITAHIGDKVRVKFLGTAREAWYGVQTVAAQNDFEWRPLPVGLKCNVPDRGVCTISEASFQPSETNGVREYIVVFDGAAGETARLNERGLWPIPGSLIETPLTKLINLQSDTIAQYRARASLTFAFKQIDRESGGIRALAASRIALLPHQAFVIGTVIDDPLWRYILADEVGLGKTIEAGTIAHQLLAERPDSRILVLCPGPLSRQWLCEMHLSFGGRDFRLLDLHVRGHVRLDAWRLVISSLKVANRNYRAEILASSWDLLVVDEAHQLLWNDAHYELVDQLARKNPRLLLLSAVPARERETELMRLLQLLDPVRFRKDSPMMRQFSALYAAQPVIGRRLRIIARQLEKLDEEFNLEELHEDVDRLLSVDVVRDDTDLLALHHAAKGAMQTADAIAHYKQLIDEVISRYRISRRILKNRRTRLVDAELLRGVDRMVEIVHYKPSQLESQVSYVALDLLQSLASSPSTDALHALFRKLAQALCDPVALYDIANALVVGNAELRIPSSVFDANAVFDYDEHSALLDACGAILGPQIDEHGLKRWIGLLRAAIEIPEYCRILALTDCLKRLLLHGAGKILVFVGTFGTAEYVTEVLVREFGEAAIAEFRHDVPDDEKERQVTRFRRDSRCCVMVSDESGGEGRNFQFADELVHFDLPWSVSAIEQRIGRLDRIGRDRPVRSFVICPDDGLELSWFRCLNEGFGVFTRSISGVEFMLHGTERRVVKAAVEGGPLALVEMISSIREASERERASDDAEALTDAASFRSASRYLQRTENAGDRLLEQALPAYMRAIGRRGAAHRVTDVKDINLQIWRLKPEEITDYQLVGLERQGENPLQDRYGTFSRSVARERPDLEFFTIGHPLVDALALAAEGYVRGRSLLVRLRTDLVAPSLILVSAWRVCNFRSAGSEPVPERAIRFLSGRLIWSGIDLETGEALDAVLCRRLAAQLMSDAGAPHDLSRDQAIKIFKPEPGRWSSTLKDFIERARIQATEIYDMRYREQDADFCEQLVSEAESIARTRSDEGAAYVQGLEATVDAIRRVRLAIDVLGLMEIEGPRRPTPS